VLNAGPGQPPIIARRAWTHGQFLPSRRPGYGQVELAFVHHTQTANSYGPHESAALVLGMAHYHRDVRGFHDIGYNFLIDRYGQIFEGRAGGIDEAVVGAQAGGYNLVSTGVGMIGSFQDALPPRAARRALAELLAWKLSLHGLPLEGKVTVRVNAAGQAYSRYPAGTPVTLNRIAGHRDGDSTDCPGNALYRRLPFLRHRAQGLVRQRAQLLLSELPASSTPGARAFSGRLTLVDGMTIPGAAIVLQSREPAVRGGETTVGSATTGGDGTWTASVQLSEGARVRALYAGDATHPAVVSDAIGPLNRPPGRL
jgi:hypothetical protein